MVIKKKPTTTAQYFSKTAFIKDSGEDKTQINTQTKKKNSAVVCYVFQVDLFCVLLFNRLHHYWNYGDFNSVSQARPVTT